MPSINVQPSTLDLMLYGGDGVEFRLICTDNNNSPVNITGDVIAQVRADRDQGDSALADFGVDLADGPFGIIVLSLTGEQTQELVEAAGKFSGVWDVQWTATDSQPRTLVQGKVECVADVTR